MIPGWCSGLGLPGPNLSFTLGTAAALNEYGIEPGSVDIVVGCNVFGRRTKEEIGAILKCTFSALAEGGEFSCTEGMSRGYKG